MAAPRLSFSEALLSPLGVSMNKIEVPPRRMLRDLLKQIKTSADIRVCRLYAGQWHDLMAPFNEPAVCYVETLGATERVFEQLVVDK